MLRRCVLLICLLALAGSAGAEVTVTWEQSDCLPAPGEEDRIEVTVKGCVLVIQHLQVLTNCCLEYKPEVEFDGETIRATEVDIGPPCDCICPFDLEIVVDGLEPGIYTLVFNAFLHGDPVTFTVTIPPCEGHWLMGAEVWATMGAMGVVVPISATNNLPLESFSFGTTYPLEHAEMVDINLEGTVTDEVGAEFLGVAFDNDAPDGRGWATCVVVMDAEEPFVGQTIPPGAGHLIANLVYNIQPPAGSVPRSIYVPLEGGVGNPPVELFFTAEGRTIRPEIQNGIIQISASVPLFVRTDVNDDGEINISDPIYLLSYLFGSGPVPVCEDAADANDDGALDVADAIAILAYLFSSGEIPPPSPPDPPGPDPTPDDLGCANTE